MTPHLQVETEWTYFFGGTVGNISTRWYRGVYQGREIEKCVTYSVSSPSTKKPKIEFYEKVRCNISKVFVYSYNRVDNYASR